MDRREQIQKELGMMSGKKIDLENELTSLPPDLPDLDAPKKKAPKPAPPAPKPFVSPAPASPKKRDKRRRY